MQSFIAFFRSLFKRVIRFFKGLVSSGEIDTTEPVNGDSPDEPDLPGGPGGFVCYYGCPNSKKAKALQLRKKALK